MNRPASVMAAVAMIACGAPGTDPRPQPSSLPQLIGSPAAHDTVPLSCSAFARCVGNEGSFAEYVTMLPCRKLQDRINEDPFLRSASCEESYCRGEFGGRARCIGASIGNNYPTLSDAPGSPVGDCQQCIANAEARLIGRYCTAPADPACSHTECAALVDSCLTN